MKLRANENVKIVVSEPWDFNSPEGDNIFTGVIIDQTNSSLGEAYLMKVSSTFQVNGISVSNVVVVPRGNNPKAVNVYYIPDDLLPRFSDIKTITEKLRFIIVGTIA
ncbi:MAG: hypothetical protein M0021_12610 [Clostridia bacterium]|nr:hypothetical protein [Clostridia bacterium]